MSDIRVGTGLLRTTKNSFGDSHSISSQRRLPTNSMARRIPENGFPICRTKRPKMKPISPLGFDERDESSDIVSSNFEADTSGLDPEVVDCTEFKSAVMNHRAHLR